MAEENLDITPNPDVPATPEPTPVELKAMDQGWVPQDQWEGDPADWRPAKEFVDRGELFKKIDELKRDNKSLRQGHEELVKHHLQVRQIAYKEALDTLRAQKKLALEEGDAAAVVQLDERIDETKEAIRQSNQQAAAPTTTGPDPMFEQWTARNSWYGTDKAMKAVADDVAREAVENGVRDKKEILELVEKSVRKEFPHKFTNPRRDAPGAVEGSSRAPANTKRDSTDSEMNDAERQMMNKILRVTPGLTKEQYLKEYKAIKSRGV